MVYDSNGFNYQGNSIASNFDTTYAGNSSAATTNFKKNGNDIGGSYTPGVSGFTNNNNIGFKYSGGNLTALISTSKPIPTIKYKGMTFSQGSSYTFLYTTNTADRSRYYLRQIKPASWVSSVDIRALVLGGGGGGGSQSGATNEGSGGGGAGAYLTCKLHKTDTKYHFECGGGGQGKGGDNWGTQGGTSQIYVNSSNYIDVYGGLGGSGGNTNAGSTPTTKTFGSSGGPCSAYSGGRDAVWPSDRSHYEHQGSVAESLSVSANKGGYSGSGNRGGGGGGGAGGEATNQDAVSGGDGGAGKVWSYTNTRYCGGGGGKPKAGSSQRNGYGGSGGGGAGGDKNNNTNHASQYGSAGGAGGGNGGGGDGYQGIIYTAVAKGIAIFQAE